jgi:hypothetical protein
VAVRIQADEGGLEIASVLGIERFFPIPVLHERAEHWLREARDMFSQAESKVAVAQKHIRAAAKLVFKTPSEGELRAYYETQQETALTAFGGRLAACAQRPLDEIFRMAVSREFTSECAHMIFLIQSRPFGVNAMRRTCWLGRRAFAPLLVATAFVCLNGGAQQGSTEDFGNSKVPHIHYWPAATK